MCMFAVLPWAPTRTQRHRNGTADGNAPKAVAKSPYLKVFVA